MTVSIDDGLIKGLLNEDNKAISMIYSTCFSSVRNYIQTNAGNEADARDVFQEAIMVVFEKARNEKLKLQCTLKTYLYSVSRYIWLKELEKRKKSLQETKEVENFEVIDDQVSHDIYIKNAQKSLFVKMFKQLSEDCQKIIQSILDGKSIQEVTRIMNYKTEQHTKNRRYRCKKSLITKIRQNPDYKKLANENNSANIELP